MAYIITIKKEETGIDLTRTYDWDEEQVQDTKLLGEVVVDMIEGINDVELEANRLTVNND